jgi:hypothetical protein
MTWPSRYGTRVTAPPPQDWGGAGRGGADKVGRAGGSCPADVLDTTVAPLRVSARAPRRDDTSGSFLVFGEERVLGQDYVAPEPVAFVVVRDPAVHLVAVGADLDVHPPDGPDVAEPLGFGLGPTGCPGDQVGAVVFQAGGRDGVWRSTTPRRLK